MSATTVGFVQHHNAKNLYFLSDSDALTKQKRENSTDLQRVQTTRKNICSSATNLFELKSLAKEISLIIF